jgi:hypothetical protein
MKVFLTLIAFLILSFQTLDLGIVRKSYKIAAQDKTQLESFSNMVANVTKADDVSLVAYKGASLTLQAKYAKTIKEKKEGFVNGVDYIEYAIEKEPNAIEPRFVRLGIQENAPKILKYRGNIEEDKAFLLKQFQHISSKNLKEHIKDYILQSKLFTEEEKAVILNI